MDQISIISLLLLLLLLLHSCRSSAQPQGAKFPYMTSNVDEVAGKAFDYIVVGGGAAGCPLAATLSKKFSVLLIERGGSPYGNPWITEKRFFGFPMLQTDEFSSVAQPLTTKDGVTIYRGRVLGGTTAINAGFYSRASDRFVTKSGWDKHLVKKSYEWVESKIITRPVVLSKWQSSVRSGFLEAGILPNNRFTWEHIEGTKIGGSTFDSRSKRHTSADLLRTGRPKNIIVLLNATVKSVIFNNGESKKTTARGIQFISSHGTGDRTYEVYLNQPANPTRSSGDVILSAGALSSPQILLLSGIGPKPHLDQLSIPLVIESNHVGLEVQDNPALPILVGSKLGNQLPDTTQVAGITKGFNFIIEGFILALSFNATGNIILIKLAFPESKGKLELNSTDPRKNPKVSYNYLETEKDMDGCVDNFEDIADVDYMKLLELDNSAEEEIYKQAMEMPLSPTLPEISFPEALVLSDVPRNAELGSIHHEEALVLDTIDMELHCNESRGHGSKITHEGSRHEKEDLAGDVYSQSLEADKASSRWSGNCGYGPKTARIPTIFVTTYVEDSRSIYRVFSATKACMDYCAVNSHPHAMLQRILHAVRIQEKISSMERSCVLFTLMVLNFSECKLVKTRRILYKDLIAYVDSLARDLQPVLSTAGGRSSFEEVCSLYELLGIIDDFLINGTIFECTNFTSDFRSEEELKFSRKSATVEQMVVGSTLLSSICTSTGYLGFVCETSYNLLRKSRCDTAFLLTILHVFAHVVREQYFSSNDFGLTMIVVRSIVGCLERKMSLVASSPTSRSSENTIELQFICCQTCPFGAVSIDVVTSVLLEKLWGSEDPGTTRRTESTSLANSNLLSFEHNKVGEGIRGSKSIMNGTMGDTSNILSLLELVSCKMGWEWTHSKVIPELLQMLERSVTTTFQIAAVLFLGEVGRFGVGASGSEDKGVESLTCKLSSFFCQLMAEEAIFSVQIATVASLLRLLFLDLPSIVDESFKCSTTASQSAAIDLVRDWFSRLSKDRQATSLSFLQSQMDTR